MPTDFSDGGSKQRRGSFDQADDDAAGKGAEHAAEAAQRHRDIGDQRKRRADIRIDVEEHRHHGAGQAHQCRAEAPAQREHLVLVDADQRHGARVFAGRLKGAAEISAVDEEIQRAERGDRYQRAHQLRHRQEDARYRDGFAAKPGMRDAAIIRREEELRQAAHDDGEPKGRKDLHHAGIGFGPDRKAHDQEINHRAEDEQAAATSGAASKGSMAKNANRKNVTYIAIMRNSPWAKFTTSIRPKISARPTAIRP